MPSYPGYRPPAQSNSGGSVLDIILRRGDYAADLARQNGAIWGNALAGAGQILAGGIMQHAEEQQTKKRTAALDAVFNGPEPPSLGQLVRVLGPKDGADVYKGLSAIHPDAAKQYGDRMSQFRDVARGIKALPEERRAAAYQVAVNGLVNGGVAKPGEVPEYSPDVIEMYANYGKEEAKPVVVGGALVDPAKGKAIYTAPKEEKRPGVGTFEDYVARTAGPDPTPAQILAARKAYNQSDDRPITINQPRPISQTAEAQIIQRLTSQWDTASKPARTVSRQVGMMEAGLEAARRGDLNAGSQAVIQTFNKILDPDSAVREGEYARTAEGQAMLSRIEGALERMKSGGAGIPLSQLETFANLARDMAKRQMEYLPATQRRVGLTADRYGIPHELIFTDVPTPGGPNPARPAPGGPSPSAASGSSGGPPVRVSSPAEAAALPPGTLYQTPDGHTMRR